MHVFGIDHHKLAKRMERTLIEHYKSNRKLKSESRSGEGNESKDGGSFYTYVALKFKDKYNKDGW
jgi:hypothetical protein